MKLNNQRILITGGSSGIGLELASRLIEKGNKVIICGRSVEKLKAANVKIPDLQYFACDISQKEDCKKLRDWIKLYHPDLNILINNAAIVHMANFYEEENILEMADKEFAINFFGPIHLIKLLLPVLEKNPDPAIINETTGLVYTPRVDYPFYNSTKSALHAFTQVLREHLKDHPTKVYEVLFPAVDTPWHKGNPPKIAISVEKAVEEMIKGLEKDKAEVKIAGVKLLYMLSRLAPAFAFKKINSL
ncbi:MAG: SDR family NAD(P)-dependent oxidoreductase [Bacteroidia bacterium]|nr:SDR family NAD(P)-dependent oxidoreductase [Bacteroidia bacterium]